MDRCHQSGLSVRAFCQAEGLNPPTFFKWRRELLRRDTPGPAFLPVRVLDEATAVPPRQSVEILLANGRCLRVGPGFDGQTLLQVVGLLEA
jgi:transposase-like protein